MMWTDIFLREWSNGTGAILNLFMLITLLMFLFARANEIGWGWRTIKQDDAMQVAMAFSIYLIGAFVTRAWIWFQFSSREAGYVVALESEYHVTSIGTVVLVVGGLCCIRVFQRRDWSHIVWMSEGTIAVMAPLVVHWMARS